jgi:hypothetical protein
MFFGVNSYKHIISLINRKKYKSSSAAMAPLAIIAASYS